MNDYRDIWTKEGGEGSKFWNTVDFNHPYYKLQEQVFRRFLHGFKYIMDHDLRKGKVESVLELGAGTGRMTKIILEIFPEIPYYVAVDLRKPSKFFIDNESKVRYIQGDITELLKESTAVPDFDMLLASEVFMHIKPEDIERIIKICCKKIKNPSGTILNIDWTSAPEHSTWCYIHDYDKLYRENGLKPIFEADISEIKQKLFCYGA